MKSDRFKVFARLFAEIVMQILKSEKLRPSFLGVLSKIFYKNQKFEPNLHSFELYLGILTFTKQYLKIHEL